MEALRVLRSGLVSIENHGMSETAKRALGKIRNLRAAKSLSRTPLFSEAELAAQRSHTFPRNIRISLLVPLHNTPERYLREMIESVRAQTYGEWELCLVDASDEAHEQVGATCSEYAACDKRIAYRHLHKNEGISANTNEALRMATGEYVGLLDHDDMLHPAALHEVMQAICDSDADVVYTDETTFHRTPRDAFRPHLKPSFAPDTLLANNYICHFLVFRHALIDEVGPFDPTCDGAQDHDMVLRLTHAARRVAHVPEILYYWRAHRASVAQDASAKSFASEAGIRAVRAHLLRLGRTGSVRPLEDMQTSYRVTYEIAGHPSVSILIPNWEHLEDLRTCVQSVLDATTYPHYEIVIVENNSSSPELFAYYDELQRTHHNVHVVLWDQAFDYARICNLGAQSCTGDYLLLLNNDTRVITPDWIQEMLMFAQRDDVGAVGAKLLYPNGTIQHAGICLGLGDVAGHLGRELGTHNPGHMGRLLYAQNLSAVTGACMMVRRVVWDRMGGMDPTFAVEYSDVDLCLRMRKEGLLVVWTPFAELYHHESRSRGRIRTPAQRQRHERETRAFEERWAEVLAKGDPYYNPGFSLQSECFVIDPHPRRHGAQWEA